MTDLTKITTPFGLMDPETQEALRKWEHGWDYYSGEDGWLEWPDPSWSTVGTYRARPAPLVPDTIDWSHVAPEWKWMARDEDGEVFLMQVKPDMICNLWVAFGDEHGKAGAFASYRRGTVEWQDSLVQRPEGI